MKKICLTGGGTAGHIMPNIALFENLKDKYNLFYIGSIGGMEEKLIKPLFPFYSVNMCKLVRSLTLKNLKIPFTLLKSINTCKKILEQEKPDIIFCKGGFVSVPVALAGKALKIPIITHESDLSLGLGNKIVGIFARKICTSFEKTAKSHKKGVYTGTAIRKYFDNPNKNNAINSIAKYDTNKKTILVVGGSLGSTTLNNAIKNSLNTLNNFNIVHIVGKNHIDSNFLNIKNYTQLEFVTNIADFFALADVVITRGGSNAIFELLYSQKNMIIVPLSKKQSRGDQIENALYFKQQNWAEVIFEEDLSPEIILSQIQKSLNKTPTLPKINGTQNIIKQIEKCIF